MSANRQRSLVSVGIATHNRPERLRRALESVTGQSYRNLEIIVSNDCSPAEETHSIIQEFVKKDPRIRYYRQEKRLGLIPNHKFVLEKARGEFLIWADDVVYFDSVNFEVIDEVFDRFGDEIFGFSLRSDAQNLTDGGENIVRGRAAGEDVYAVNWKKAKSRNAKYPFELNSTIYKTSLVKEILRPVAREHPMLKRIFTRKSFLVSLLKRVIHMKNFLASLETFHAPNTLEGYCYRWCKTHKRKLPSYLYFQRACASAIQVNRVNTVVNNPTDGRSEYTVEALNERYKQGYRFDIEAIENNKPRAPHVGREYFRLVIR